MDADRTELLDELDRKSDGRNGRRSFASGSRAGGGGRGRAGRVATHWKMVIDSGGAVDGRRSGTGGMPVIGVRPEEVGGGKYCMREWTGVPGAERACVSVERQW